VALESSVAISGDLWMSIRRMFKVLEEGGWSGGCVKMHTRICSRWRRGYNYTCRHLHFPTPYISTFVRRRLCEPWMQSYMGWDTFKKHYCESFRSQCAVTRRSARVSMLRGALDVKGILSRTSSPTTPPSLWVVPVESLHHHHHNILRPSPAYLFGWRIHAFLGFTDAASFWHGYMKNVMPISIR
jgi:hypothetical protein